MIFPESIECTHGVQPFQLFVVLVATWLDVCIVVLKNIRHVQIFWTTSTLSHNVAHNGPIALFEIDLVIE